MPSPFPHKHTPHTHPLFVCVLCCRLLWLSCFFFMSIILQLLIHTWWNFAKRTHAIKLSRAHFQGVLHCTSCSRSHSHSLSFSVSPLLYISPHLLCMQNFENFNSGPIKRCLNIFRTFFVRAVCFKAHTIKVYTDLNWDFLKRRFYFGLINYYVQRRCVSLLPTHTYTLSNKFRRALTTYMLYGFEWVCAWSIWIRAWKHLF